MMLSAHSYLDPHQVSEGFLMEAFPAVRFPLEPFRNLAKLLNEISEDLDRQFHRERNIIGCRQVEDCSCIIR